MAKLQMMERQRQSEKNTGPGANAQYVKHRVNMLQKEAQEAQIQKLTSEIRTCTNCYFTLSPLDTHCPKCGTLTDGSGKKISTPENDPLFGMTKQEAFLAVRNMAEPWRCKPGDANPSFSGLPG